MLCFYYLCFAPPIIRIIKWKTVRWLRRVSGFGNWKCAYNSSREVNSVLGKARRGWEDNIKIRKYDESMWTELRYTTEACLSD